MADNPLLFAVMRAQDERDQRRVLERALEESKTAEKALDTVPLTPHGDPVRMRNVPITSLGVAAVQPGTQPLQALLDKEHRLRRSTKV